MAFENINQTSSMGIKPIQDYYYFTLLTLSYFHSLQFVQRARQFSFNAFNGNYRLCLFCITEGRHPLSFQPVCQSVSISAHDPWQT